MQISRKLFWVQGLTILLSCQVGNIHLMQDVLMVGQICDIVQTVQPDALFILLRLCIYRYFATKSVEIYREELYCCKLTEKSKYFFWTLSEKEALVDYKRETELSSNSVSCYLFMQNSQSFRCLRPTLVTRGHCL